jgi:hypothetical protein
MSVEETVADPAPEAAVVEPTTEAPVAEVAADPAVDRDDKGRFRNPVQPRIDELTRKVRENEREAAFWRARAEAAEKPAAPAPEKPTADKFDDYGAYVEALAEWKADEKVAKALEARDKASAEKRETETRQTTWQQRQAEALKTIPDLSAVLEASDVQIAAHVSAELLDSEFGPHIAYKLAKDSALAEKLNGMTPNQAAREIGRLEASFAKAPVAETPADPEVAADPAPAPAPVVKKVTAAPPPVKPIGQGRSSTVDLAKINNMDDYVAARTAQGASWARR